MHLGKCDCNCKLLKILDNLSINHHFQFNALTSLNHLRIWRAFWSKWVSKNYIRAWPFALRDHPFKKNGGGPRTSSNPPPRTLNTQESTLVVYDPFRPPPPPNSELLFGPLRLLWMEQPLLWFHRYPYPNDLALDANNLWFSINVWNDDWPFDFENMTKEKVVSLKEFPKVIGRSYQLS